MIAKIVTLWHDEDATTTVEYALLLTTVTLASIGAWTSLGESIRDTVNNAAARLEEASGTGTASYSP